ncbi:hypothetical protein Hanom_Chr05g00420151 [Helianthus anomalus]
MLLMNGDVMVYFGLVFHFLLSSCSIRFILIFCSVLAAPELYKTWTKVVRFKKLDESLRHSMKCMSLIVFPGKDMLCQPLLKNQFANKNLSSVQVSYDILYFICS